MVPEAYTLEAALQAWLSGRGAYATGKPQASDLPAFGSFQEWTGMVGGVLAHVGIGGFLGNLGELHTLQDGGSSSSAAIRRQEIL